jgi:hypothetical protein
MTFLAATRLLIAASLIAAVSPAAMAAPKSGWNGTWGGAWGGKASEATSVTLSGDKVVSYTYQGTSTPVTMSTVTAKSVSYGDNGTVVVLTKTGKNTAFATLHTIQGDATAQLTKE